MFPSECSQENSKLCGCGCRGGGDRGGGSCGRASCNGKCRNCGFQESNNEDVGIATCYGESDERSLLVI